MTEPGPVARALQEKFVAAFAPLELTIEDESACHHGHAGASGGPESHFRVRIVSAAFAGLSRVARQRLVYAAAAAEIAAGLHALGIAALTPEEAEQGRPPSR
jgi:BolA family transcriptional regulator, general stress-responsive regulator